jgi:hypothetical protein
VAVTAAARIGIPARIARNVIVPPREWPHMKMLAVSA